MTASTGSLARLVEVKKVHPAGRKDIVVECVGHFRNPAFPRNKWKPNCIPVEVLWTGTCNWTHHSLLNNEAGSAKSRPFFRTAQDIDVNRLSDHTIEDLTQWLGLPPAHTTPPAGFERRPTRIFSGRSAALDQACFAARSTYPQGILPELSASVKNRTGLGSGLSLDPIVDTPMKI